MTRRWLVVASLVAAFGLVAASCGDDAGTSTTDAPTTTAAAATTTTEAPDDEVAFDVGVTPAPCADAVNEANGCIYLGIISDLADGPFAALGIPLTQAQEHFWAAVNADGGLDGFDVITSAENTFDARYTGEGTVEGFEGMVDRVLMFAQILGTPQTQAVVPSMIEANVVAAPATWWSGWAFSEFGGDNILESGAPYCLEAMNGMYFMSQALPEGFTWGLVRFPGDYGGDYGAGALIAAAELGLGAPVFDVLQIPLSAGGDVTEAVTAAVTETPTLIVIVTGPSEMAQIVGGTFQGGHQAFQVLGASPTWNVALLGQEALLPLLEAVYKNTVPWGNWDTESDGHAAMRAAAEAGGRDPKGAYIAGWTWQYPVKALLEAAIASGDLTRANLAALAANLGDVSYEGILPDRTYGPDVNATIDRSTIVMGVDPESSDGLSPLSQVPFTSPLAADFDLAGPCFAG